MQENDMNKGDETENMVIEAEESIYADKLA